MDVGATAVLERTTLTKMVPMLNTVAVAVALAAIITATTKESLRGEVPSLVPEEAQVGPGRITLALALLVVHGVGYSQAEVVPLESAMARHLLVTVMIILLVAAMAAAAEAEMSMVAGAQVVQAESLEAAEEVLEPVVMAVPMGAQVDEAKSGFGHIR